MDSSTVASEGVSAVYYICATAFYVLLIIAQWKVFTKAHIAGWLSLIPIVNVYYSFKIAWGNGWMFLLMLIPIVDIVIYILFSIKMAKAFGQGTGFAVGLIFLPSIFALILGFGNAEYVGVPQ